MGRLFVDDDASHLDHVDLVQYTGCWVADGPASLEHRIEHRWREICSALAADARQRYRTAIIDLHPTNRDVRPFTANGWQSSVRYTLVSDLTRHDEVSFTPDVRRRAKRAAEAGVFFDCGVTPDEFVRLWSLSFKRQGLRQPIPAAAFCRLLEIMPRYVRCTIHGARLANGRLVAANVVIYDDRTAYYWQAGFDSDEPLHGT